MRRDEGSRSNCKHGSLQDGHVLVEGCVGVAATRHLVQGLRWRSSSAWIATPKIRLDVHGISYTSLLILGGTPDGFSVIGEAYQDRFISKRPRTARSYSNFVQKSVPRLWTVIHSRRCRPGYSLNGSSRSLVPVFRDASRLQAPCTPPAASASRH